jgi:hypothetical protein
MLLSAYQAVLFFGRQGIEQEYACKAKVAASPSLVKPMSAFTTCISKALEQYWNVPANDRQIRSEIDLLPKRIML